MLSKGCLLPRSFVGLTHWPARREADPDAVEWRRAMIVGRGDALGVGRVAGRAVDQARTRCEIQDERGRIVKPENIFVNSRHGLTNLGIAGKNSPSTAHRVCPRGHALWRHPSLERPVIKDSFSGKSAGKTQEERQTRQETDAPLRQDSIGKVSYSSWPQAVSCVSPVSGPPLSLLLSLRDRVQKLVSIPGSR